MNSVRNSSSHADSLPDTPFSTRCLCSKIATKIARRGAGVRCRSVPALWRCVFRAALSKSLLKRLPRNSRQLKSLPPLLSPKRLQLKPWGRRQREIVCSRRTSSAPAARAPQPDRLFHFGMRFIQRLSSLAAIGMTLSGGHYPTNLRLKEPPPLRRVPARYPPPHREQGTISLNPILLLNVTSVTLWVRPSPVQERWERLARAKASKATHPANQPAGSQQTVRFTFFPDSRSYLLVEMDDAAGEAAPRLGERLGLEAEPRDDPTASTNAPVTRSKPHPLATPSLPPPPSPHPPSSPSTSGPPNRSGSFRCMRSHSVSWSSDSGKSSQRLSAPAPADIPTGSSPLSDECRLTCPLPLPNLQRGSNRSRDPPMGFNTTHPTDPVEKCSLLAANGSEGGCRQTRRTIPPKRNGQCGLIGSNAPPPAARHHRVFM
jgi:hypothetical protein